MRTRNSNLDARIPVLAAALGKPRPSTQDAAQAVAELVSATDRAEIWLAIAVLSGRLPDEATVVETARAAEFDRSVLYRTAVGHGTRASLARRVRVVTGQVVVDVAHTSSTTYMTGIQRVVRETTRRWLRDHDIVPVGWTSDLSAMRDLTPAELYRIERAAVADGKDDSGDAADLVVPWRCRLVVPELAIEPERVRRIRALARLSGNAMSAIGFDLIPLSTGEASAPGMPGAFASTMTAMRHADHIATISEAAAVEYRGWSATLAAIGIQGPAITPVELPIEAVEATAEDLQRATDLLVVGRIPLVLVVGSHEPRKNHLAVLHAAELLWREGHEFSLAFVGGRSWEAEAFEQRLLELQEAGRPVSTVTGVSEGVLWAAYRLARFTVFPSFNEGYGLPVAESLAVGTPAITSKFGSMLGIAEPGGCLVVDPRDDWSIRDAMRSLLADDAALETLRVQAGSRPRRSWDEYAAEVWDAITPMPSAPRAADDRTDSARDA